MCAERGIFHNCSTGVHCTVIERSCVLSHNSIVNVLIILFWVLFAK